MIRLVRCVTLALALALGAVAGVLGAVGLARLIQWASGCGWDASLVAYLAFASAVFGGFSAAGAIGISWIEDY